MNGLPQQWMMYQCAWGTEIAARPFCRHLSLLFNIFVYFLPLLASGQLCVVLRLGNEEP